MKSYKHEQKEQRKHRRDEKAASSSSGGAEKDPEPEAPESTSAAFQAMGEAADVDFSYSSFLPTKRLPLPCRRGSLFVGKNEE